MILRAFAVLALLTLLILYIGADSDYVSANADFGEASRETAELLLSEAERIEKSEKDALSSVRLAQEARNRLRLTERGDALSARFRARTEGHLRKLAVLSPLEASRSFAPAGVSNRPRIERLSPAKSGALTAVTFKGFRDIVLNNSLTNQVDLLKGPEGEAEITALAIAPGDDLVVAGYADGALVFWTKGPHGWPHAPTMFDGAEERALDFAFSPDGALMVAALGGGEFRIYRRENAVARDASMARLGEGRCQFGFSSAPSALFIEEVGGRIVVAAATSTAPSPVFLAAPGELSASGACPFRTLPIVDAQLEAGAAASFEGWRSIGFARGGAGQWISCCKGSDAVRTLTFKSDRVAATDLPLAGAAVEEAAPLAIAGMRPRALAVTPGGGRIAVFLDEGQPRFDENDNPKQSRKSQAAVLDVATLTAVGVVPETLQGWTGAPDIFAFDETLDRRTDRLVIGRRNKVEVWLLNETRKPRLNRSMAHGDENPVRALFLPGVRAMAASGDESAFGVDRTADRLQTIDAAGVSRTWSLAEVPNEIAHVDDAHIRSAVLGFLKSDGLILAFTESRIKLFRERAGALEDVVAVSATLSSVDEAIFVGDGATIAVFGRTEQGDFAIETFRLSESGGEWRVAKVGRRAQAGATPRLVSASAGFATIEIRVDDARRREIWDLRSENELIAIPAPRASDSPTRYPNLFFSADGAWAFGVELGESATDTPSARILRVDMNKARAGADDAVTEMIYGEGDEWTSAMKSKTVIWTPAAADQAIESGIDVRREVERAEDFGAPFSWGIVDASPLAAIRDDVGNISFIDIETGKILGLARQAIVPRAFVTEEDWNADESGFIPKLVQDFTTLNTTFASTSQTVQKHGRTLLHDFFDNFVLIDVKRECGKAKTPCLNVEFLGTGEDLGGASWAVERLSPKGRLFYAYGDRRLVVVDLETGAVTLDAQHGERLRSVYFDDAEERFVLLDASDTLTINAWLSKERIDSKIAAMDSILPDARRVWRNYRMKDRDLCYSGRTRSTNFALRAGQRLWDSVVSGAQWVWTKVRDYKASPPPSACGLANVADAAAT